MSGMEDLIHHELETAVLEAKEDPRIDDIINRLKHIEKLLKDYVEQNRNHSHRQRRFRW